MSAKTNSKFLKEIERRKTFAIISHPDAGKTTITEKLLLFGGAIHMAGMVKAKRAKQFAKSDWMEIEKQRGISVSSSVMQFEYEGFVINLLDTPGHQDFSEDTYRVLTAVDSSLMVIDSSKGIELQTRKLFQVCRDRHVPIMTFMNKVDLEGRDPFELIDQIEKELSLQTAVMTWPIGQGRSFHGTYDRRDKSVRLLSSLDKNVVSEEIVFKDLEDPALKEKIPQEHLDKLKEDLELLEALPCFSKEEFLKGRQTPVFFGSAIKNFGIRDFLDGFTEHSPMPLSRQAKERVVNPDENNFSGVIFKLQANMDPKHRDRIAFLRVCSGEFKPGCELYHTRLDRKFKINNAITFLSQERKNVENAYAGDIIGIYDKSTLMIGDSLSQGEQINFKGIPQFSPELFCRVELKNPIKSKQLAKGLNQLAAEGTSQLFHQKFNSDYILGVVGNLQFEVVKFRLQYEYGAEANFAPLPYSASRWYYVEKKEVKEKFESYYANQIVYDIYSYPMILFKNNFETNYIQEKFPEIKFYSSLIAYEEDQT